MRGICEHFCGTIYISLLLLQVGCAGERGYIPKIPIPGPHTIFVHILSHPTIYINIFEYPYTFGCPSIDRFYQSSTMYDSSYQSSHGLIHSINNHSLHPIHPFPSPCYLFPCYSNLCYLSPRYSSHPCYYLYLDYYYFSPPP